MGFFTAPNGYRLTINDRAKALAHVTATYHVAVELFANLCKQLKLNPLADGVIISHSEAHKRGWGSSHADPEHLWNALNCGYTMTTFRNAVANKMKEDTDMTEAQVKQIAQETAKSVAQTTAQTVAKSTAQTAAQAVVAKLMNGTGTGDNNSKWAEEATNWAKENGLIVGLADKDGNATGDYAWQTPMTRQEMVALLYRFSKMLGQN